MRGLSKTALAAATFLGFSASATSVSAGIVMCTDPINNIKVCANRPVSAASSLGQMHRIDVMQKDREQRFALYVNDTNDFKDAGDSKAQLLALNARQRNTWSSTWSSHDINALDIDDLSPGHAMVTTITADAWLPMNRTPVMIYGTAIICDRAVLIEFRHTDGTPLEEEVAFTKKVLSMLEYSGPENGKGCET